MSDLTTIISARIRQCRINHGWTIEETVKPLGLSTSRYSNWEQSIRRPKLEEIIQLAQRFGVASAYIAGLTDNSGKDVDGLKFISVSNSTIPVKDAIIALQEVADTSALNRDYIRRRGLTESKLTCVPATDNSMTGIINIGDEVLIDRSKTDVQKPDIFAILVNKTACFRWIKPELNGTYTISAEDKIRYPDEKLTALELNNLKIVGRVARICRDR